MNIKPIFIFASLLIAGALPVHAAQSSNDDRSLVDAAIAAVKPALVRIHVASSRFDRGREEKEESSGSGVIVSADGYVVTNHHVASHAKTLICTMANRDQVEADLIGTDALTDISVLKLRGAGRTFPFAKWGDSGKLLVGDVVLAMGSPLALSQSVTRGIVSNTEMTMPDILNDFNPTLEGEDVGSMVRWIGHDALIQPGNSGGPLVNLAGEVIGINEIELGLSGAIPSEIARPVSEALIKEGTVKRATIGVSVQPLLKSMALEKGVLISGVLPKSPADAAGIKAGDVLMKLAGQDVIGKFVEQVPLFNRAVAALPIGQAADVVVLRDGKTLDLKVTPVLRRPAEPDPVELKEWGLVVSDISEVQARERRLESTDGALVNSVRSGGPCGTAKPSIQSEDIVVEVDGTPIKSANDLVAATEKIRKGQTGPTSVLVAFRRDTERLVSVVILGKEEQEDPGREAKKAYLPVATQVLTPEIAKALKLEGKQGFRVTRVRPESSAGKAGLQVGDVIVAVDDQALEASQPEDGEMLAELIRQYDIGAKVELKVLRKGVAQKIAVQLEETPLSPREMRRYRDEAFEFTVREMAAEDRTSLEIDAKVGGVLVEAVGDAGWAALGKLQAEDVILSVSGKPVTGFNGFKEIMESVAAEKPKYVVVRVLRGIQEIYLEFAADWSAKK